MISKLVAAVELIGVAALVCALQTSALAQKVEIDGNSAISSNLKVVFSQSDPEQIDAIYWNPAGLNGSETNLTGTSIPAVRCAGGLAMYFGNSWAPPDPQNGGKVLVGSGTNGSRMAGPDNKLVINSLSEGCDQSAGVGVNTTYKFWQGGTAANKMRATRTFSFETAFHHDFRPYIPRLVPAESFSQVYAPNSTGTALLTYDHFSCPFGCEIADWNGNVEALSWFALHDAGSGRGMVIKREPNDISAKLWLDWDGGVNSSATSVLLKAPQGGFTGEVTEKQTICFYDVTTWSPSLTLPPGC